MPRSTLQQEIRKRRPFAAPEEEAFLNLQRTAAALSAEVERLFKSHGMSGSQYNALRILRGAKAGGDDALPCLEVAQRMITPVPDITRLIDRLEQAGHVERCRTSEDRRVVLVSITRAGLELLSRIDKPLLEHVKGAMNPLNRTELRQMNLLLVKLRGC